MTRRIGVWQSSALFGACLAIAALGARMDAAADTAWLQWGGPNRNFNASVTGLKTTWPEAGPAKLWDRALGEGHSAIVGDANRLYTMYRPVGLLSAVRRSRQEVVAAFDPATGTTAWEFTYDAPVDGLNLSEGAGPHSTPLVAGNRLFAMSSRVELFALDPQTGKQVWAHNLVSEFGARQDNRGYSPSPIAYRDTVIVPAGGKGSSVAAFNQQTGAVVWRGGDFALGPGSPILIAVNGQDQLVVSGADEMVGMNPSDGAVLWRHPHKTEWGLNISTPVWNAADNTLFVSAAYNNGSRLLKLTQAGGKTTVEELWYQNRMRVHIGSVIRIGGMAVGSSGDFGGVTVAGIDLASGKVLWQSRNFMRSTFVYADDKLIVLDEDGTLGLATASPSGLQVLAKAPVLTSRAWTTPTLVGTRLYVRDRARMMAFDLAR